MQGSWFLFSSIRSHTHLLPSWPYAWWVLPIWVSVWVLPNMALGPRVTACSFNTDFPVRLPRMKLNFPLFTWSPAFPQSAFNTSFCPHLQTPTPVKPNKSPWLCSEGSWTLMQPSCAPNKGIFHFLKLPLLLYCAKKNLLMLFDSGKEDIMINLS